MIKTITWVIVMVILIGGGYYALNSDVELEELNNSKEQTSDSVEENNPNSTQGKKMAFSQFLKQGGSYKCEVNQYIGGDYENVTKGITYVSDGMIRGEYNSKTQNISVDSTVIVRDGYTYSWTSMAPTMGFKAKVVTDGQTNTNTGTSGNYSWNADQIGDYSCEPWAVDISKFTVPTNINFQELNK